MLIIASFSCSVNSVRGFNRGGVGMLMLLNAIIRYYGTKW